MALDPLSPRPGGERPFPLQFHPHFQIVRVSTNGLVVRCSRAFEAGSTIGLGVHLHMDLPAPTERSHEPDGPDAMLSDTYVDFKAIVVDCHEVDAAKPTVPLFEVTLFFDSITDEQCAALLLANREGPATDAKTEPLPNFPELGTGFDRVCGLN